MLNIMCPHTYIRYFIHRLMHVCISIICPINMNQALNKKSSPNGWHYDTILFRRKYLGNIVLFLKGDIDRGTGHQLTVPHIGVLIDGLEMQCTRSPGLSEPKPGELYDEVRGHPQSALLFPSVPKMNLANCNEKMQSIKIIKQ